MQTSNVDISQGHCQRMQEETEGTQGCLPPASVSRVGTQCSHIDGFLSTNITAVLYLMVNMLPEKRTPLLNWKRY